MEEKKNTGVVVVLIALFCLLIGGVGGYFVSTNFWSKNESNNQNNTSNENTTNNQNQTTVEDNTQSKCRYQKLKDASLLTGKEKKEIFEYVENSTQLIISPVDYTIKTLDEYSYLFSFYIQYGPEEEAPPISSVIIYKENGKWKNTDLFGSGSEFGLEGDEKSSLCEECGDCK